jgi:phage head maturation protease
LVGSFKRELHKGLTTASTVGDILRISRKGDPSSLSPEDRAQILADAVAGRDVRLVFDAVTYIQRDTPNRRFVRFKAGALVKLAASFAGSAATGDRGGVPFLRDHEQDNALARGGTVLESKLVDHNGAPGIWMRVELTVPWAVEMALRGVMDRFSIGWNTTGIYECSVCGKDMLTGRWTKDGCTHWPGDVVQVDGQSVTVEAVITDAVGVEVSAVSVPAVTGTEVQDIRAALSAARSADGRPHEDRHMNEFKSKIVALLALSVDAADDAVLGAIGALRTEANAQREAASRLQAENERLTAAAATAAAAQLDADIGVLMNDAAKKLGQQLDANGQRVEGELETALRTTAKTLGMKAARELLARLPQVVPATIASNDVRRNDVTPPTQLANGVATLTAAEKKSAKEAGVTEEAYAATKAALYQPQAR